ncbi:MAG: heavy metal sensor histidine kinase [Thiohalocapsa sp.]
MKAVSLTARLSLLFALSTAGVILGLGWTLERAVAAHFRELDRHEIEGKLVLVRNLLAKADTHSARAALPAQIQEALVGHPGLVLQVQAADGSIRFARGMEQYPEDRLRDIPATEQSDAEPGLRWVQWQAGERSFQGLIAHALTGVTGLPPVTVTIGLDTSQHERFMIEFRRILVLTMALAATAAAVLGWGAARTGLRPLRRVTSLAAGLDTSQLGARLPEVPVPAEIKHLVVAFNSMLARLEDGFRRLTEFSADIAHELRTPISNLTIQTQVALSAARDADAYREVLYSSLEEYERLARMMGDMLYLAQADNGLLRPAMDSVDLADQVQDLFDYFDAWAEERGVTLRLNGSARVRGDPLMLRRALSNLLSNAIRHTHAGQQVRVNLEDDGRETRITIGNPGPAIPPDQLPRLFERFYRADPARQRQAAGSATGAAGTGLGLAIVKSIVAAHGGGIAVTSGRGWNHFVVTLPCGRNAGGGSSVRAEGC